MFTGIVQATCEVVSVQQQAGLKRFEIAFKPELLTGLQTGASVATNGVCLTVTKIANDKVYFDVMEESLGLTNLDRVQQGDQVNIERSLTFGSEIGGHILSGHIHTQAEVISVSDTAEHYDIELALDTKWKDYVFYKGFVAVNGCSLTVGQLTARGFKLHFIPETLRLTNIKTYQVGDKMNIEIDSQTQVIVDTVERILAKKRVD
ncbi:riboflavin synthase subunit alpha [Shewanella sp. OMA3-2]|uniref:riboflavin synthase subunit alpha n=1 Tax=Shewanella sp. OMA3-2 TaxID=2908650 RepID=UPI001F3F2280|nr:riboflavin synthase subunit alpha [Shewanella sp. OMA3-2]UJF20606.1 riboflavin synthase subunit alpha [Shewanella sp. OMA3-2]